MSLSLNSPELEYFSKKIMVMPPNEICEEALDVICESAKFSSKGGSLLMKYADIIAGIAWRRDYPLSISEKALSKYAEMIFSQDLETIKKEIIKGCISDKIGKVTICIILNENKFLYRTIM